jgi:putative transposase
VEVFRADEWLATAYPQGALSDEQRAEVLAARRRDAAELGRRQRRASRRARARLAPITEPRAPVAETTVVTASQARADRADRTTRRDDDLRSLAMTNLLDFHTDFAYWNPDLAPRAPEDSPAVEAPPGETCGEAP